MNVEIRYSKASMKFLQKHVHLLTLDETEQLLIMAIKNIFQHARANVDVKPLRGEWQGYYRVRKGKMRIIFSAQQTETLCVTVHAIDFRGNVY